MSDSGGNTVADKKADAALSVVVAALTYKRPELLTRLLAAFASMDRPPETKLTLLLVDNDEAASARPLVEAHQKQMDNIRYVVEERRGIPVARNRAVDEATALGADLLCFIDDDEYPAKDWIVRLIECRRRTGAQLIGGPVGIAAPPPGVTPLKRLINWSLGGRATRKYRKTARAALENGRYTIVTNNWLCDMAWQAESGLRFDEALLMTGGSDTDFFRRAKAVGCVMAWCPEAIVYETIETDRLSWRYQVRRAALQSLNHFRMKNPVVGPMLVLSTLGIAILRLVLGVLLLVIPVYGRASPVMALRSIGWAIGRVMALAGKRSNLYE